MTSSGLNTGPYSWPIWSGRAPGTDYKVKITSTTTGASDTSNANFVIT